MNGRRPVVSGIQRREGGARPSSLYQAFLPAVHDSASSAVIVFRK